MGFVRNRLRKFRPPVSTWAIRNQNTVWVCNEVVYGFNVRSFGHRLDRELSRVSEMMEPVESLRGAMMAKKRGDQGMWLLNCCRDSYRFYVTFWFVLIILMAIALHATHTYSCNDIVSLSKENPLRKNMSSKAQSNERKITKQFIHGRQYRCADIIFQYLSLNGIKYYTKWNVTEK